MGVDGPAHTEPEISTHFGTCLHTPRLGLRSHTDRPKQSDVNLRLHRYEPDRRQQSRGASGFIGYSSVKSVVNTPVPKVRLSRAVGINHAPVSPHLIWTWRAPTCLRRQCGRAHTSSVASAPAARELPHQLPPPLLKPPLALGVGCPLPHRARAGLSLPDSRPLLALDILTESESIRLPYETAPLFLPLSLSLFLFFSAAAAPAASAPRPNIIVLLCDDLGYGDLSCFAHPEIRTPNLDQLARDGVKFTDCYSASPVCSPSRAGLMTGRNPNRLGIRD